MATAVEVQTASYTKLDSGLSSAEAFVSSLDNLINAEAPFVNIPAGAYDASASLYELYLRTPVLPSNVVSVSIPSAPSLTFSTVGDVTVPEFSATPPSVDIPTATAISLPAVPTQPEVQDVALPTAPTVTLPTAPSLSTISVPLPPSITIPDFTSTLPAEDFLTPSNTFSFAEQAYVSALLDAEKAKLLNDLENGGYGIEALDETNLWNRARDREVDVTLMEIEEAYRNAGARGFPLPPGDIAVVVERASQKQQEKLSSVSREIAIKRGDMFVDNRKFTITEVRALETMLMNYHGAVQERGLNVAKATLDAAISIYEAQLKRYNARLDAYKTYASVYEAKLRAVSTQVDIYRAQIQASQVTADIQKIQVETYNAQLRGVELTFDIYKTQMEAANITSQIQRTKIEAFRALIDAYTAQVQAQVAVQNAYEARIKGELAKVQVYETQAKAYAASVDGLKVRAEILINRVRAEYEQARVRIESYKGQIEGADISLKAQLGIVDANTKGYQAQTQQYEASANAVIQKLKLDETSIQNAREINLGNAKLNMEGADLDLRSQIETLRIQAQALSVGGSYYSNLINALAGSIQAIATVSG